MLKRVMVSIGAVAMLAVASCSSDDGGSSGVTASSGDDFCSLLLAFAASNDTLGDDVTSGDPDKASAAMQRIVGQVQLLQDKAPADIKTDVDTASTFITDFDALLAKYGYDLTKIENDPAAADEFATLNDANVSASLDQLRLYGESECGATTSTG